MRAMRMTTRKKAVSQKNTITSPAPSAAKSLPPSVPILLATLVRSRRSLLLLRPLNDDEEEQKRGRRRRRGTTVTKQVRCLLSVSDRVSAPPSSDASTLRPRRRVAWTMRGPWPAASSPAPCSASAAPTLSSSSRAYSPTTSAPLRPAPLPLTAAARRPPTSPRMISLTVPRRRYTLPCSPPKEGSCTTFSCTAPLGPTRSSMGGLGRGPARPTPRSASLCSPMSTPPSWMIFLIASRRFFYSCAMGIV
ncbi:unnamed protein product [Musa textilis]